MVIDNGNHLLLSGNHAAMSYVRMLGSEAGLVGPPQAEFAFIDLPWKVNPKRSLAVTIVAGPPRLRIG